jgi:hypothetical protein
MMNDERGMMNSPRRTPKPKNTHYALRDVAQKSFKQTLLSRKRGYV